MMTEYFGTKFYKDKFTRLDGLTVVSWVEDAVVATPFTVCADRTGVNFKGTLKEPISDKKQLNDFARLIADAWKEHVKLAPKVSATGIIE